MTFRRLPHLAALLGLVLLSPAPPLHASPPAGATIPTLSADTLSGAHVHLPADLNGRPAILVLGFSKDSRTQVRDWGKRLADDFFSSPDVPYYEMAVVASVPRLLRGMVVHSIASEVSERGRQHFVPVPDNEARWRALVGYRDPNLAYVLLMDGSGRVQWTTSGPLTDAAYSTLRQHLASLRK